MLAVISPSVAVVVDAGLVEDVVDVLRPNPGSKPGVVVDSRCRGNPGVVVLTAASVQHANTELSVGWVDSWVGLGWSGWVEIFFQFKKFDRIILMHLKHG